ncbi:hypothetical protein AB0L57_00755 [Nocardia sp. NPDC052254]|uniref:hypothetical protein n=1 Tax=Nocardia sp. NPDC052254 TaxID=3155681 RepID=UPI00344A8202
MTAMPVSKIVGTAGAQGGDTPLSTLHVHWSAELDAFVALSSRHPGIAYHDHWSSLAAIEGLLELIEQSSRSAAIRG